MARILVVEDEENLSRVIHDWLVGDRHVVDVAGTGGDARHYLIINDYDIVILDRVLPDMEGVSICKELRQKGKSMPVLMLTGKKLITDKEEGFHAGADDYLTKPFDMQELTLRVDALLRRPASLANRLMTIGAITIDPTAHVVLKDGKPVNILPRDFVLLEFLGRYPGQVFTADDLIMRVWPSDKDISVDALRQSVRRIRAALDEQGQPSLISTVFKIGYRLNAC